MESLATQVLVIYVIRTTRAPWKSRPSRGLVVSTLATLAVGLVLPLTPAAQYLGFLAPPIAFYPFLLLAILIYLGLVETGKRWFFQRHQL